MGRFEAELIDLICEARERNDSWDAIISALELQLEACREQEADENG